ncbi:MAG: hypothetical protein GX616_09275, partial [Planctomycetes bacterium]|nr:hypothetical protein [Planctomycetota bacterium]
MSRVHHSWAMLSVLVAMAFCVATPAAAIDMYWTGEGDNDNWYSRHFTGLYDGEGRAIYTNNWGQIGIDPPTPGAGDHAVMGGEYVVDVNWTNNPSIWELTV